MHQTLDTLLELDERTVVRDRHDTSAHPGTDRVLLVDVRPGVRQELLESQRDALAVPIDVEDLHVEIRLADVDHLGRVTDAAPRHVRDVEQSVETAQVDERTEVGDVLDRTLADLADEELLHERLALLLALGLEDHAARNDDVPAALVELDDLELVDLADQVLDVRDPAQRDLRPGEEGVHAHEVDGDAALDLPDQRSLDRAVGFVRLADLLPDAQEVGLLLREDDDPVVVFEALEEDLDLVTFGLGASLNSSSATEPSDLKPNSRMTALHR